MNRPAALIGLPRRFGMFGIVLAVIGLLLLSIVFGSWYTVDQGERGVKLRYGAIVGIAEPGLNFKIPFVDTVRQISVQNQAIVYERVESYSKDQQPATLRISVSFRVPEASVEELYSQYGTIEKMVERLISRKVPDEVKNVFGRYTAISAIQDRTKFGIDVNEALKKSVSGPVTIDSVQIEEVIFSDAYEQSIEKRMMAEVEIQTKRQNLETERINAEITVTQAEKWNGVLPTTMVPGGTVPFLNLKGNTNVE